MQNIQQLNIQLDDMAGQMGHGARLYGIIDAGIYGKFIDMIDMDNPGYQILFKDAFAQEYESVAPYLVELDKEESWAQKIISEGYGKTWLTFVVSRQDMSTLAFELRERINIYSEKHEREVIFRFYDPRNLERYFKILTQQEIARLFADINGIFIIVDMKDKEKLNIYHKEGKEIVELVKETEEVER